MSEIDDTQVQNLLNQLSEENRRKVLFNAIKKGAQVLQRNTINNLKVALGTGANSSGKLGKPITQGVKLTTEKAYNEVKVHIMGDFRLKFFEKGTKERLTKKGASRGSIKPSYFFRTARQNESEIDSAIFRSLDEQLNKIQ